MGLFKWRVLLKNYGDCVAHGWVKATSNERAQSKVRRHYISNSYIVIIEDDYNFFNLNDDEIAEDFKFDTIYNDGVIVRYDCNG